MTSNSFSFEFTFFLFFFPVLALAGTSPAQVRVPVATFHVTSKAPAPLSGALWFADAKPGGRAILLLNLADAQKGNLKALAPLLQEQGFSVLLLDLRNQKQGSSPKTLTEDVQSGVVFLKTHSRIQASRVAIVGAGIVANGAAHYAGANRQMMNIVDSLVLINLDDPNEVRSILGIPVLLVTPANDTITVDAVEKQKKLCQTRCRTLLYPQDAAGQKTLQKDITDFLLRPHG